jgi:hypothetical protein
VADHNDPKSVNSIFSDIESSAADVYDMFGYPSDAPDEQQVVLALTFAPVPDTDAFDTDMLYRLQVNPHARPGRPVGEDRSLSALAGYSDAMTDRYLGQKEAAEIRVSGDQAGMATVRFAGFPGGSSTVRVPTNEVTTIRPPTGGEVHDLHHLAAFCADVVPDPPAAVAWAERDARIRRNGAALSLLVWCLYRAGRTEEARAAIQEALALGGGDPRLRAIGEGGGLDA